MIYVYFFFRSSTSATTWRDAKTVGNFVYIISEAADHGLQVYDLTQLRDMTGETIIEVEATLHYAGFGNAHNIVANEETGYIYVVGATSGNYPELCEG